MKDDEVEAVASAFFQAESEDGCWDLASEELKDVFRMEARLAIACLDRDYLGADAGHIAGTVLLHQPSAYLH